MVNILNELNYGDIHDLPYIIQYVISIYIVTETFCTVGYGDLSPNPLYTHEHAFYMMVMLTGVGIFTILIKRS
jgi:hypothetical protein